MNRVTFAKLFCARHSLDQAKFDETVLRRSLYPLARLFRPVLGLIPGYFAPDREFISCVGGITELHGFYQEAKAYAKDPNNRGFLRWTLRLRVSAGRLFRLVRDTLEDGSKQAPATSL